MKVYYGHHIPTGEDWLILGINIERNQVCVAGWPATRANLSDMRDIKYAREATPEEEQYRLRRFGNNWDESHDTLPNVDATDQELQEIIDSVNVPGVIGTLDRSNFESDEPDPTPDNQPLTAEEILNRHRPSLVHPNRTDVLRAMEEYATQQTASLKARVEELEKQSQVVFRDLENEQSKTDDLYSENEKLWRLLEQEFKSFYGDPNSNMAEYNWQRFCKTQGIINRMKQK